MRAKTLRTIWKLRTYDVWGNAHDGWDVNDVYSQGTVSLRLRVEVANNGTLQEFAWAAPTDRQLQRAFGVRCALDTDGDDCVIYVNRSRDGYPLGELDLVSHRALSPIDWERL
jgi:hypothetical protein